MLKKILVLFICTAITSVTLAQEVDFKNAPLNPIAYRYTLSHFNLKGDVYAYEGFVFDRSGRLQTATNYTSNFYQYDSLGNIKFSSEDGIFITNRKGQILQNKGTTYSYTGNLISTSLDLYKKVTYSYDINNRVVSAKTEYLQNKREELLKYSYRKSKDTLLIKEEKTAYSKTEVNELKFLNGCQVVYDKKQKSGCQFQCRLIRKEMGCNQNYISNTVVMFLTTITMLQSYTTPIRLARQHCHSL